MFYLTFCLVLLAGVNKVAAEVDEGILPGMEMHGNRCMLFGSWQHSNSSALLSMIVPDEGIEYTVTFVDVHAQRIRDEQLNESYDAYNQFAGVNLLDLPVVNHGQAAVATVKHDEVTGETKLVIDQSNITFTDQCAEVTKLIGENIKTNTHVVEAATGVMLSPRVRRIVANVSEASSTVVDVIRGTTGWDLKKGAQKYSPKKLLSIFNS